LFEKSSYRNIEIIIVENNSEEAKTFSYYEEIQKKYENVKVVKWENEFNYAAINNFGVTFAKGDYYLFLNNDTEVINETAVSELLGCYMKMIACSMQESCLDSEALQGMCLPDLIKMITATW